MKTLRLKREEEKNLWDRISKKMKEWREHFLVLVDDERILALFELTYNDYKYKGNTVYIFKPRYEIVENVDEVFLMINLKEERFQHFRLTI